MSKAAPGRADIISCVPHHKEYQDMTQSADQLAAQIQETVNALSEMEHQLRATQSEVSGLGFFARGFVEKDISSNTGRSFGDWISATTRLRTTLSAAQQGQQADARRAIQDELPRIASLRQYLQRAPQKINMVPAAVLKPQQRAEFLRHVSEQEQNLQSLETKLQAIANAFAQSS
jgi:hypothetical protein